MNYEVTGKITKVLEKITGTKKDGSGTWEKQNFVLETTEQYNNLYCFELFGAEKIENFTKYNKVGDSVKVDFNVSTNEWQGKYFTSLQAWKTFKAEADVPNPQLESVAQDLVGNLEDTNDLPF